MKMYANGKIKRVAKKHKPGISVQTGFPSPATHYLEPTIDLNQELVTNPDATFFIRVQGNAYKHFGIFDKTVLIIDRSLLFSKKKLALIVKNGMFDIISTCETNNESFMLWGMVTYIIKKTE